MRNLLITTLVLLIFSVKVLSSGIQVLNTTVTTNDDKTSATVKFTLIWDHSWRLDPADPGPKNWDAAWVFIKFRTLPGDNWSHGYIKQAGSDMPSNAEFKIGNSIAVVGGVNSTVGVGAFIYRKDPGSGQVVFTDCELYWDFASNGLTGGEQVEVCVLATEMVHIPAGAFYLGDYSSVGRFTRNRSNNRAEDAIYVNAANPAHLGYFSNAWLINAGYANTSNGLINSSISTNTAVAPDDIFTGQTANNTNQRIAYNYGNTTANNSGLFMSGVNANYPRGYNAFYCMKYEITQGEYLQFLNKNLVAVKNAAFYIDTTTAPSARFNIRKKPGTGTPVIPAEYEFINPSSAYLPCNFLGTKDIMAWLIWAGLRPMTELEYEKVCRGPELIPGTATLRPQYAWGSVNIYPAAGFSNKGGSNEGPSNTTGNVAVATTGGAAIGGGTNDDLDGPMRAGGFANPVSSREKAGATYYGVMEMSGNLWERCVSVGIDAGRAFLGNLVAAHGNGEIGPAINPDLPIGGGWPPVNAAGLGFRGGSYLDHSDRARISDRQFINLNNATRHASFGGRGVRTDL